jgi:hypothetical protein
VETFLVEAPHEVMTIGCYIVIAIFGIFGACRCEIAKKMFPGRNSTDAASTSTNVASTSGGATINCPMTSEFTSASGMFDISENSNCTFNFNLYETKK